MDGLPIGATPLTVTNIPEGPHWFTLNGYEETMDSLKKKASSYEQAKKIIAACEKSAAKSGDSTSMPIGEMLTEFGYIRFNGKCDDTERIHYNFNFSKQWLYYVNFNANI